MSARHRLISGFMATAGGPLITAVVQIVSVPAFLQAWGAHLYGEWLIMCAVPMYLSVTDMGFGSVAGNDMTMRVVAGDREGAVETFQSTSVLVVLISLAIASLVAAAIFAFPVPTWLRVSLLPPSTTRLTLLLLSIYSLATLYASLLLSAFRSGGQYSYGMVGINAIRLLENAGMLGALFLHGGPVQVSFALALLRVAGTLTMFCLLKWRLPWLAIGIRRASTQRIRELTRPAIAFMAFPAGNALNIQGMTVLIGIVLGPLAVATFTPMRTLSRFAFQIIDSVKNAAWPELSAAYGAQNWVLARKLHRTCCQVAFWFAVGAVSTLALVGPTIFRVWTHGRITMDIPCFYLLLIVVLASSLWNTSSAVSIAANKHEKVALQYFTGTTGSLVLAYFLMPRWQMAGATVALLACDVWMSCFVIRGSNKLLRDQTLDFLRSMFSVNQLRLIAAR